MANFNAQFVSASANIVSDYNVGNYWEFPQFQPGLLDLLRRKVTILNRIQAVPSGPIFRYKEQTKLPSNAQFVDTRTGVAGGSYGLTTVDADHGYVERAAFLKAMVSRISFTLFDKEAMMTQGQDSFLLTKAMNDAAFDFLKVQNQAIWTGSDTSLSAPTTQQYMGILNQITTNVAISSPVVPTNATAATGDNYVTDAVRDQIATLESNLTWDAYPTAIYANPLTINFINKQEWFRKGNMNILNANTMEIAQGFKVGTISTMRGDLPLIPDPYIPVVAGSGANAGKMVHQLVAVNENLIERPYMTAPAPRTFKMSISPTLVDDYLMILFDSIVVKGADHAHFKMNFAI